MVVHPLVSVVVVGDLEESHGLYPRPVEATVILGWIRICIRLEDESLAVRQVNGQFTIAVAPQLVATPGKAPHLLEVRRGLKVGESGQELFRTRGSMGPLQLPPRVAQLLQLTIREGNFQRLVRFDSLVHSTIIARTPKSCTDLVYGCPSKGDEGTRVSPPRTARYPVMKMTSRRRPAASTGPHADALSRVGVWLAPQRRQIRDQVVVNHGREEGEERTKIRIDHLLHAADAGVGLLRIHTHKTFLPRAHFSSEAKMRISNAARSDSGRAIYCVDPEMGEVIAAVALHLPRDPRHPVLLTAIALRDDVEENRTLAARSIVAGLVLKHYVHAISHRLDRGGHVDIDLASPAQVDLMRELGFKKAPKISGFRPAGTHLRQAGPVSRPRIRVPSHR